MAQNRFTFIKTHKMRPNDQGERGLKRRVPPPPVTKENPQGKPKLHPRNLHRERYDFPLLIAACPDLAAFVQPNIHGGETIDFANPAAVKMLNKALLKGHYGVDHWDIPQGYLCPPIPGRADYIHHLADLLAASNYGKMPAGQKIRCLDIGVGANCIYPILGHKAYGWHFVGSDIDPVSIAAANSILEANPLLKENIECRLQPNPQDIFYGVVQKDEYYDLTLCNPPFHASLEAAEAGTLRKLNNLNPGKVKEVTLNFGGQHGELWCEGGEKAFITNMIRQSRQFTTSIFWFSTLVSKQSNLKSVYEALSKAAATEVRTIPMGQGNKTSRIVAWSFLTKAQQKLWREGRWRKKE